MISEAILLRFPIKTGLKKLCFPIKQCHDTGSSPVKNNPWNP